MQIINKKYMIASIQITKTKIFAFITVLSDCNETRTNNRLVCKRTVLAIAIVKK